MHCLPAQRGLEVTADVIDSPSSLVWEQAANGLPTEQAMLHTLIRGARRPEPA
jgi:ornithine carbamoyltransferase